MGIINKVPHWRIVKPVDCGTRRESISYEVIITAAEPYTDDEIEVFAQTHGNGIFQEMYYELY